MVKVLKFGGTSVGSAQSLAAVLSVIQKNLNEHEKVIVVCSAMSTVTNKLLDAGKLAATGNKDYALLVKEIEKKHLDTISLIINDNIQEVTNSRIKQLISELSDVIKGIFLLK